jgi:hypothetical protein
MEEFMGGGIGSRVDRRAYGSVICWRDSAGGAGRPLAG